MTHVVDSVDNCSHGEVPRSVHSLTIVCRSPGCTGSGGGDRVRCREREGGVEIDGIIDK